MKFSQSTLKLWMECPLQAKFAKLDNLPRKSGSKATFGSCIHSALDHYNRTGDVDMAIKLFTEAWEDPTVLGLPEIEVWNKFTAYGSLRTRGVEILRAYHDRMKIEQRSVIVSEHHFLVPFGEHELSGIVDLVSVRKNHRGTQLLTVEDYKALEASSPILTPEGWRRIDCLGVGDQVIGVDGHPTRVEGVYPQGRCIAYRVTFDDGASVVCSEDHLWTVTEFPSMSERTKRLGDLGALKVRLNHRYNIPTVEPVIFAEGPPLPVDPYVLGVLIGDGHLTQQGLVFTKPDPALWAEVARRVPLDVTDSVMGRCAIRSRRASAAVTDLGLRVRSKERFIPEIYLRASVEDRLDLLRGLMDTDGSASNRIQYRTGSERLAGDFKDLCRSLGGIPHAKAHRSYYKQNGLVIECGPSWHCSPNVPFNPFMASTKAKHWTDRQQRVVRYIDQIDRVPDVEMVCIRVAHPRGLFVTKDMIVTHNTATKPPNISELALDIQFSVYLWAVSQPEFWFGNGEGYPAVPNAEWYYEMLKGMPKRGIWVHLWQNGRELDAGGRDDEDFARLYRLCCEVERAIKNEVFVPHIGEACQLCDYSHGPCPVAPPSREWWEKNRPDEDENSWA